MVQAHDASLASGGFTLVELLMALAISAILMSLATPSFHGWMLNRRIRATAEAVLYAVMQTREEAVRRNASVSLTIEPRADGGMQWTRQVAAGLVSAGMAAGPAETAPRDRRDTVPILYAASTRADAAPTFGPNPASVTVTFNGLGNLSANTTVRRLDFRPASGAPGRPLAVVLTMAGAVRLCDPALSRAQSVQGC